MRDAARGKALHCKLKASGQARVSTPLLDLASLGKVATFLEAAGDIPMLDGVLLNAGVQSANTIEFTEDGYETTFAVNHLANHLLMRGLLPLLSARGIAVWTASGTRAQWPP